MSPPSLRSNVSPTTDTKQQYSLSQPDFLWQEAIYTSLDLAYIKSNMTQEDPHYFHLCIPSQEPATPIVIVPGAVPGSKHQPIYIPDS
ncbi:hypothetical protein PCASD_19919 [Puccinia coronata f. sp. avenae]|uniref:Uncharacterized protein n=1 Tax=Puccinia coronata f. sp. avenae TaxID=200324 RepID=A0A2N5U812_9BASI|nr:hypothetical protein PCASD_19919 [Puccinia coronata f. sp. avenae]